MWANLLAYWREKRGMTQLQLAAEMGISNSLVSQVENGTRAPWPKFVADAARVLDVDPDDLFPGYTALRKKRVPL